MTDVAALLNVEHLSRRYGGVVAVKDVSFEVPQGSIAALIGPNGAGKTTTLNVISGLVAPTSGRIVLAGENLAGKRSDEVCRSGIARTFQTPQIFRSMSVRDNLKVGTMARGRISLMETALSMPRVRKEEQQIAAEIDDWLEFVGLRDDANRPISELPFGRLRFVEVARALAAKPSLLLMDEPSSGLSRAEAQELRAIMLRIRERAITVLLVEHNMPLVMSTADLVIVLDKGQLLAGGTPTEIRANAAVRKAYLGTQG
jgi:ABC-type branched-subunit amino acid transport system ATPase component